MSLTNPWPKPLVTLLACRRRIFSVDCTATSKVKQSLIRCVLVSSSTRMGMCDGRWFASSSHPVRYFWQIKYDRDRMMLMDGQTVVQITPLQDHSSLSTGFRHLHAFLGYTEHLTWLVKSSWCDYAKINLPRFRLLWQWRGSRTMRRSARRCIKNTDAIDESAASRLYRSCSSIGQKF